ncbi:hypothetical protein V2J09_014384 [Rumex salicifolius]
MFSAKTLLFFTAQRKLSSFAANSSLCRQNPPSLSVLADNCSSMKQLKQVHAQMIVTGRIIHDNYAASRLLSFCAVSGAGDLSYAAKLFRHTPEPNSFMWNTMIRAEAGGSKPCKALILFVEMKREGAVPGKHTFPFVLKGCSNLRSLACSEQIHAQVLVCGFDCDLHVVNTLVKCYTVAGKLEPARQVFDEMPERNLSIWTTMVCGYAQNDCTSEALVMFDRMTASGFEPNGATLASVLSACAREGWLELGERIHDFMKMKKMEIGVILGTALVHMYSQNGAIKNAQTVFDEMPERNIRTWNAMIHGLAIHGHGEEAINLFKKLQIENQIMPNEVTFLGALSACCHAGLVEEGRAIFYSMKSMYKIEPKIQHFGIMVDLLGRQGRLLEAEEIIREMTWKADVMSWGALLSACRNYGNVEVAERTVEEILALDPHNHGVYVILSNMYAESGRWEDVSRLRKLMKMENLQKTPEQWLANNSHKTTKNKTQSQQEVSSSFSLL